MKKKLLIIASIAAALIVGLVICLVLFLPSSENENAALTSSSAQSEAESSVPSSSETESAEEPEPEPEINLLVTNPQKTDITVNTPKFTFRGSGDPAQPLIFNGEEITLAEDGLFSVDVSLKEGPNTFKISHKEKTLTYTVRYKKIIIKSVYPSSAITVGSGKTFNVSAVALKDSTVSASFNGITVMLSLTNSDEDDPLSEYATYVGSFEAPINTGKLKSYGQVKFSVTSPNGNVSMSGGEVKVKTLETKNPDIGKVYPQNSTYKNVGNTFIAEVICDSAETFDGDDTVDTSRPTNNYLPKGTVDYCSPYTREYYTGTQTVTLYTLRYGNQLYENTKNTGTNIKVYKGTLPETNTVSLSDVAQEGHHTVMTFDVGWKAPFRFNLTPQGYASPGKNNVDYRVQSTTYEYVDIVFCYAESLKFNFDFTDHPVFSRYKVRVGKNDCVLRLYLRKEGKFYGWSAEYNAEGQLEFRFLCPTYLTPAKNEYGYSLKGVTILIDAGHGGKDPGAVGFVAGKNEAELNLSLAAALKRRLEALGATVIMTRSDGSYIEVADRMSGVRKKRPDFAISIHRDASASSAPNGFASYYFNPFSAEAAHDIFEATAAAKLYKNSNWAGVKWHYFFLCRNTECPVVLTENGFITNSADYGIMINKNEACAKALVDGIMKYFIANRSKTNTSINSTSSSSSTSSSTSTSSSSSTSTSTSTSSSSSSSTSTCTSSSSSSSSSTSTSTSSSTSSSVSSDISSGESSDTSSGESSDTSSDTSSSESSDTSSGESSESDINSDL